MKLNFLNVLKGKSSPDEIAEQIAALELKKAQCEKTRDAAKNACKELRGKTMCGEVVDPEAVRGADKAYEEAVLDLEIVSDSLAELHKKLYASIEALRDEESRRITEERQKWQSEQEKLWREISRLKGRLFGIVMGIYGHPEGVRRHLESYPSFSFSTNDSYYNEFTAEKERAEAELKRPSPSDLNNAIERKQRWLDIFNLEEEYQSVLKKYRKKYGISMLEAQPVEV